MPDSEFIAEVRLEDSDLALSAAIRATPEMSIELDYQIVAGSGAYYTFFEVSGGDFDAFERAVEDDPTVADCEVVTDGEESRVYRMRLLATDYLVLSRAAELGMRVTGARASEGGWVATFEVPDASMLQEFRSYCVEEGVTFTTRRIYRVENVEGTEYGLTPNQREVLVAARDAGYFEVPRAASLQDVADDLDISSSAASGRLRRGIEALLAHAFPGE